MYARAFNIGAVVSLTSGRLLVPFKDMHEVIEFVAGRPVWTHELAGPLVEELQGIVMKQHPWLSEADAVAKAATINDWESAKACVSALAMQFAPYVSLTPSFVAR